MTVRITQQAADVDVAVWLSFATRDVVHRVPSENARRIRLRELSFGLAECGAACVRDTPSAAVARCAACFPAVAS